MQKRESFFGELNEIYTSGWQPAPREYSSLVANGNAVFLIGGQNYDTNKELGRLTMSIGGSCSQNAVFSEWKNIVFESDEKMMGRCRHTTVTFNNKLFTFGGCYMYNKKR